MLKSVWVNYIRVAQREDGRITITVQMPDDFSQSMTLTRADFADLVTAVEAYRAIK